MISLPADESTIAVFLPTWVGDVVMATPALRALRAAKPQALIVGVVRGPAEELLQGTGWIDQFIHYRKGWIGGRALAQTATALRRLECSTALLLSNSFTTAAMSWLGGCRRRVGFARYNRRWLLTDTLQAPRDRSGYLPRPATQHYIETLAPLDIKVSRLNLELTVTDSEASACSKTLQSFVLGEDNHFVVLNTGGAYGAAKRWPDESFSRLARQLAAEIGIDVIVNCGPAERESAAQISRTANHPRVHSMSEQPASLGLTKALIARAALLISGDSGPRHIGAAFQVPTIALFGSTDPRWSDNGNPNETILTQQLDCQPCGRRTCPLVHHRCMRELTVEQVFEVARRLLSV